VRRDSAEAISLEKDQAIGRRYRYICALGACVYLVAVWYAGWGNFRDAFLNVEVIPLVCAALVMLASVWLRVLKWRFALDARPSTQLYFMSKAGGEFTPSRVGELSPLFLTKFRTPRVAAWIVMDRLLEMAATLAYGALGAAMLQSHRGGLLPMVGIAALVLVIAPVILVTRQGLFAGLAARASEGGVVRRAASFLVDASGAFKDLRGRLLIASAFTALTTGLDVYSGVLAYRAFGCSLAFPLLAVAQCMHGLVSAVPFLPNATGIPYAAAGVLVNQVGGAPVEVIAAVVAVYVLLGSTVFWGSLAVASRRWGRDSHAG
jgi:hypothetical protein